jgi:hypothetical protein
MPCARHDTKLVLSEIECLVDTRKLTTTGLATLDLTPPKIECPIAVVSNAYRIQTPLLWQ